MRKSDAGLKAGSNELVCRLEYGTDGLPSRAVSSQIGQTQTEIAVVAKPIRIEIESPTDWPAIAAPFVLGAAAFYFAWANQRQQIRSSIANFRDAWLQQLRSAAVEFSAAAAELQLKSVENTDFLQTADSMPYITRLFSAQSTILLMLDSKKDPARSVEKAMKAVAGSVGEDGKRAEFAAAMRNFVATARVVLDNAWIDIKTDLGHHSRWPFNRFKKPQSDEPTPV